MKTKLPRGAASRGSYNVDDYEAAFVRSHEAAIRQPADRRGAASKDLHSFQGRTVSQASVDRTRVRKCGQCVLHFLDTSKKGTRRWCSMQLCGNRLKVAAYALRKRL